MELTRSHPQHLRDGKKLFMDVVAQHDVPVQYAIESALVGPRELMANAAFAEMLCDELASRHLRSVFSGAFADFLLASFSRPPAEPLMRRLLAGPRRRLRLVVPAKLRVRLQQQPAGRSPDLRWIALRACIASRMLARLASDARNGYIDPVVAAPVEPVAMRS